MRCFLDMDGVLADYDRLVRKSGVSPEELADRPGAFLNLELIPGAKDAVPQIMAMGFDVYIASKPAADSPMSYHDKVDWIIRHFPDLRRKVIFTQDKGLLGSHGDFLVDDRPHKANCVAFPGFILHFSGVVPATLVRQERICYVKDWTWALNALKFLKG